MDPLIEPDTAVARSKPTLLARDGYYPLAQGSLTVRLIISSEAPICNGYAAVLTPIPIFLHTSKCAGYACARLPCGKRQALASRTAYSAWSHLFKTQLVIFILQRFCYNSQLSLCVQFLGLQLSSLASESVVICGIHYLSFSSRIVVHQGLYSLVLPKLWLIHSDIMLLYITKC